MRIHISKIVPGGTFHENAFTFGRLPSGRCFASVTIPSSTNFAGAAVGRVDNRRGFTFGRAGLG
jgi:hypothetical protein